MTSTSPQIHVLLRTTSFGLSSSPSGKPSSPNFFPRRVPFGLQGTQTTAFGGGRRLLLISSQRGSFSFIANAKANPTGEQKWTYEGSVTESLPNGMFRVRLDNEDMIIGYISGKIRKNFVRILPGDRVKVEVSRYDSSRGRIVYRLRNRDSTSE